MILDEREEESNKDCPQTLHGSDNVLNPKKVEHNLNDATSSTHGGWEQDSQATLHDNERDWGHTETDDGNTDVTVNTDETLREEQQERVWRLHSLTYSSGKIGEDSSTEGKGSEYSHNSPVDNDAITFEVDYIPSTPTTCAIRVI